MNKIYRMVHADGFRFKAFGIRFGVRTNQPFALARIKSRLAPGSVLLKTGNVDRLYSFVIQNRKARPGFRSFHLLYGDAQMLARAENDADLMDAFASDLNLHIATAASTRFFVHAGVVAWNGKAIIIPGRSQAGKTTLVREFLRQGATYYSDEFAVFSPCGHIHAFPKALGIRDDRTQQQTPVAPEQLGCPVGAKPLQAGLVLLTHYHQGSRWRPRTVSRGRAALHLLQNSYSVRQKPEVALAYAEAAVRNATILQGVRGEAEEVVRAVLLSASGPQDRNFAKPIAQPQRKPHGKPPERQAQASGDAFAGGAGRTADLRPEKLSRALSESGGRAGLERLRRKHRRSGDHPQAATA